MKNRIRRWSYFPPPRDGHDLAALPEISALREFDAVPITSLDQATVIRAQARLEQIIGVPTRPEQIIGVPTRLDQIIAAPPMGSRHRLTRPGWNRRSGANSHPAPQLSRRQLATRLAGIPLAAGLIIAGSVLVPEGAGVAPAFATWTAIPEPLVGPDLAAAADVCSARMNRALGINPAAAELTNAPERYSLNLAERRGDWAVLDYSVDDNAIGYCLIRFENGTPTLSHGEIFSTIGNKVMSRALNPLPSDADNSGQVTLTIAPGTLLGEYGSGELTVINLLDNDGPLVLVQGSSNDQIQDIVVHTTGGQDVTATVENGRFVAWWPNEDSDTPNQISRFTISFGDGHAGLTISPW